MPSALGVKLGLSALPPLRVELPIELPPVAHPDDVSSGPQTEKLTVPAGVPPVELPVTVTESDVAAPSRIEPSAGVEVVLLSAGVTVKHSVAEPSLDAR